MHEIHSFLRLVAVRLHEEIAKRCVMHAAQEVCHEHHPGRDRSPDPFFHWRGRYLLRKAFRQKRRKAVYVFNFMQVVQDAIKHMWRDIISQDNIAHILFLIQLQIFSQHATKDMRPHEVTSQLEHACLAAYSPNLVRLIWPRTSGLTRNVENCA